MDATTGSLGRHSESDLIMEEDCIPALPARIVIRTTKSLPVLGTSAAQKIPQQSRHRAPVTWMGRGNPGSSRSSQGTTTSNVWMGQENLSDAMNERSVEGSMRSGCKRAASFLTNVDSSTSSSSTNAASSGDVIKRFRGSQILSEEWRNSPSLARPVVVEENLASLLLQREIPGVFRKNRISHRAFYTVVTPNHTVLDVQHPALFLRKFSPDGRFFVAFSAELQVVHVFRYRGVATVLPFFHHGSPQEEFFNQHVVQRDLFKAVLREEYRLRVVSNEYMAHSLAKDFSLFTDDGQFLIVVSSGSADVADDTGPEVRRTNESLPLVARNPLEDYKFTLISLLRGEISDQLEFKVDKIPLHHTGGVYLQGTALWILSTQHQQIHLFEIVNGKFVAKRTLGQHCFTESGTNEAEWNCIFPNVSPADEVFMGTMRQKLFTELFRTASRHAKKHLSYGLLVEFHRHYTFYKRLKMWKFQLLDGNRLLIKWAPEDVVTGKASDPSNFPQFFTFFDVTECRFFGVFDYREGNMLRIFEKFSADFRNPQAQHPHFQCDTFHSGAAYERLKRLSITAKSGGSDVGPRLLSVLPIPCQSFTPSPYVDMTLFQYDASLISNSDRLKGKVDEPIRFYSRDTGTLNFTLQVAKLPGHRRNKRVVTQIFHPFDPLIITYEKQNAQSVESDIHFHVWKPS